MRASRMTSGLFGLHFSSLIQSPAMRSPKLFYFLPPLGELLRRPCSFQLLVSGLTLRQTVFRTAAKDVDVMPRHAAGTVEVKLVALAGFAPAIAHATFLSVSARMIRSSATPLWSCSGVQ